MNLRNSIEERTAPPAGPLPMGLVAAGMGLAWLVMLGFLTLGLVERSPTAWVAGATLFTAYFAWNVVAFRGRARCTWTDALPWLIFAAPLVIVLLAAFNRMRNPYNIGLRELGQVCGTLLVAHLLLRRIARRESGGAPARRPGPASTGDDPLPRRAMAVWLVGAWLLSTAFLVARFGLFQAAGHPEDTAYLWDCFRNWQAGRGLVSPWISAWGHHHPTHYFALHFSPGIFLFLGLTRFLPHLSTLLILQNLAVLLGLWLVARAVARPAGGDRLHPSIFPGAPTWVLALLVASPPLNSALRTDLHPILWALPLLGVLHLSYDRRRAAPFLLSGLLLFTLREDLGWVWGMYAPLAWLEGRRRPSDAVWLAGPLVGFAGTLIIQQAVIPRFGAGGSAFFQLVFGTESNGLIAFLLSMAHQPLELIRRLLRPGNLLLLWRLLATGVTQPFGSWRWLPGLPLAIVFSLVDPGMQLLNLSGHYILVPALFLAVAGLAFLLPRLARLPPGSRHAWLVALWALGLCQPSEPELPTLASLRHPLRARAEVAADLALADPRRPVWLPGNLLLASPRPDLAVPIHRMAVLSHPPGEPGTPTQALLPVEPRVAAGKVRLLSARYGPFERTARGHNYDLYELVRR